MVLASTLIPLAFDLIFIQSMSRFAPSEPTFFVSAPGIMIGVTWGFCAAVGCMVLGACIGLPAALFEAVRTRSGTVRSSSRAGEVILAVAPWLATLLFAYCIGYLYVFPPIGAALLTINTILARCVPVVVAAAARLWEPLIVLEE